MESYGIPWAPVFGNHDREGNATLLWQADRFEEAEHCLFDRGPANMYGVGNYFVNIFEGDEPVYSLCLMDNGRYNRLRRRHRQFRDLGRLRSDRVVQVERGRACRRVRHARSLDDLLSLRLSRDAGRGRKYAVEGEDGRLYIPEEYGGGSCAYEPCAPDLNSGLFDVAKTSGLTHAFFGHDHENDAYVYVDGVRLGYGFEDGAVARVLERRGRVRRHGDHDR